MTLKIKVKITDDERRQLIGYLFMLSSDFDVDMVGLLIDLEYVQVFKYDLENGLIMQSMRYPVD